MADPLAETVDSSPLPEEGHQEATTANPVADGSTAAAVAANSAVGGISEGQVLVIDGQSFSNLSWSEEHDGFFAQDASGAQFLIKREFIEMNGLMAESELTSSESVPPNSFNISEAIDTAPQSQQGASNLENVNESDQLASTTLTQTTASIPAPDLESNLAGETAVVASGQAVVPTSTSTVPPPHIGASEQSGGTSAATNSAPENRADLMQEQHDSVAAKPNEKALTEKSSSVNNPAASTSQASQSPANHSPTKSVSSTTSTTASKVQNSPNQLTYFNYGVKTNNQLVNSRKNYSKKLSQTATSTLVWITPELRNGNSGNESNGNVLTTTIEIAENPDEEEEGEDANSAEHARPNSTAFAPTTSKSTTEAKSPTKQGRRTEATVAVENTSNNNNNVDSDLDLGGIEMDSRKSVDTVTGGASRRSGRNSLKKEPTPSTDAAEPSRKRTRASIDSRNGPNDMSSSSSTTITAHPKLRKNVSFDLDCLKIPSLVNDLQPNSMRRHRQMAPDPSGFIRNPLEARPSRAKEVRTAAHFNDVTRMKLQIHTRIQSQLGLDELKHLTPFVCVKCGLTSLSMRTQRYHRESCFGSEPTSSTSRFNGRLNHSPAKNTNKKQRGGGGGSKFETEFGSNPPLPDNDSLSASSDSDEAIDEQSQSDEEEQTFEGFTEKNVVWVQTKHGLWPALIDKIFPAQRKLCVFLFDYPHRRGSYKVPMSETTLYDDGFTKKKLWKETAQMLKAVSNAEKYMRNKCLSQNEMDVDKPSKSKLGDQTAVATRDEPLTNCSDGQEDSLRAPSVNVETARILTYIKDGNIEGHLCGVYTGAIDSQRHRNFLSPSDETQPDSIYQTGFGPFTDEEDQDALFHYCSNLFKTNFGSLEQINDYVTYILNVWIPEAILKAITKLYPVDWEAAEQIFKYHSAEQLKKL